MASTGNGSSVVDKSRRWRLALISAEPTFRLGLRGMLAGCEDIHLVAEAAEARAGFPAVDAERPDLVVLDLALRGMNGAAATREIKRRAPEARVLLVGGWACEREALEGFAAGADGFFLKTEPVAAVLYAIRAVARGEVYVAPDVRGVTLDVVRARQRAKAGAPTHGVLQALSAREREVLDLVIKGWRNRDISRELCVSIKTIDTHRTRINRKLRCRSSADLVRFAAENGLLRKSPVLDGPDRPLTHTMVLLIEEEAGQRGDLQRDMIARGFVERQVSRLPVGLDDLPDPQGPSLYVLEPGAQPGSPLRAMAWLPDLVAGESFQAALARALPEPEALAPPPAADLDPIPPEATRH